MKIRERRIREVLKGILKRNGSSAVSPDYLDHSQGLAVLTELGLDATHYDAKFRAVDTDGDGKIMVTDFEDAFMTTADVELGQSIRKLVKSDAVERSADFNSSKAVGKKRPPDPSVDLSNIRSRELENMMTTGQARAEAALMGAGFMAGASAPAIAIWVIFALGFGGNAVLKFSTSTPGEPIASSVSYAIQVLVASTMCTFRAYFLYRKMYRRAYWSLLIIFSIWAILVMLNIIICFIQINLNTSNLKLYLCGDPIPSECSGLRFLVASVIHPCGLLCLFFNAIFALLISSNLAEGRLQQASGHLRNFAGMLALGFFIRGVVYILFRFIYFGAFYIFAGVVAGVVGVYIVRRRQIVQYNADLRVKKDREKYDTKWHAFLREDDNNSVQLKKLSTTLSDITERGEDHERRSDAQSSQKIVEEISAEANRDKPSEIIGDLGNLSPNDEDHRHLSATQSSQKILQEISAEANSDKPRQIIGDLVTLFAQAHELNEHFQECVAAWAKGITGSAPNFVEVKRRNRAIEKLFRSYSGDAARLVDLVRSSINFSTVDGLLEAVERIKADERVAVLKFKNRFDASYDSRDSAGFRNVALSLILVDEFTVSRGIDMHICELQLGLKFIDIIKNDNGHRRYVEWRDMLGE